MRKNTTARIDRFLDLQAHLDDEYRRKMTVHTLPCVDCGTMVTGTLSDRTYLINEYSDGAPFGMCENCNAFLPSQLLQLSRVRLSKSSRRRRTAR